MSLLVLHDRLSATCAMFAMVMGLWAVVLALRGRGLDGNYLGAIVVGEGLMIFQGAIGAWLWFSQGARPDRGIHLLYGAMAALIWPFLFSYTRGGGRRVESVMFAAGSLFLWGLVMRAVDTASFG